MEHRYTAITGASSGIGRAAAVAFAKRGMPTILIARRKDRLEQLAHSIESDCGTPSVTVRADLSRPEGPQKLWDTLRRFPLQTLVNCAGFGYYGQFAEQACGRILEMLQVNVTALTCLSHAFVQENANTPGAQLMNVSSAGGYRLVPGAAAYCASKFYVSALTEALDRELQASGCAMRAKVLAPAATETEFGSVATGQKDYSYDEAFPVRHSAAQMAQFLMDLYDSDLPVGAVDRDTFQFTLQNWKLESA